MTPLIVLLPLSLLINMANSILALSFLFRPSLTDVFHRSLAGVAYNGIIPSNIDGLIYLQHLYVHASLFFCAIPQETRD